MRLAVLVVLFAAALCCLSSVDCKRVSTKKLDGTLRDMKQTIDSLAELVESKQSCDQNATDCEGTEDTLMLNSVGEKKLNVIKSIKSITGLGLKESKELADSAPSVIVPDGVDLEDALDILEEAGADVEIVSGCTTENNETETETECLELTLEAVGIAKLNVIKAVKSLTGLGLKDSKELVDSAPSVIPLLSSSSIDVLADMDTLNFAGATTSVQPIDCSARRRVLARFDIEQRLKALEDAIESLGAMVENLECCAEGSEKEETEVEPDCYDVVLVSPGGSKLSVVKTVKSLTGLGLKESKELVDSAPSVIREGTTSDDAQQWQQALEEAGAEVNLEEC